MQAVRALPGLDFGKHLSHPIEYFPIVDCFFTYYVAIISRPLHVY